MKKLGIIAKDDEAKHVTEVFDKFLKTTMQPQHFDALHDFFPAAKLLTNAELLNIASQASDSGNA